MLTGPGHEDWEREVTREINELGTAPDGIQAISSTTTGFTVTDTMQDYSTLSVTWILDPTRRYRLSWIINLNSVAGVSGFQLQLTDAGNNLAVQTYGATTGVLGAITTFTGFAIMTSVFGGSTTRKLRIERSAGSNFGTADGGFGFRPARLLVEDVGPA